MKSRHSFLFGVALAVLTVACASRTPPAVAPPATTPDGRVASADGVSIHYVAEGSGPVVVLSHCLGCDLHYWDAVAADLRVDHRVIRLDLAGHGESGAGRKDWTVKSFVADIRAVVDAAGADKFTLVGHSMSGTIALEAALELGDRVTAVVPVDSVLDVDLRASEEDRSGMLTQLRTHYLDAMETLLSTLLPKNPNPAVVERVRKDARSQDPERAAAILEGIFEYSEAAALDRLRVPIVSICSDLRPVSLEHNRAHAPQFDAHVLPNTGHWLMLDEPAEFQRTLREVLRSIESGTARRRD